MNITKKTLEKSQIELTVDISIEEFKPYISRGAEKVSMEVKIEGFRPGKAPFDILKAKVGEMTILEEAAKIAVDKTVEQAIRNNVTEQIVGQPQINISKLAPGNALEYKIVINLLPDVKLGKYKELNVKEDEAEVKDEEVEKLISELREMRGSETLSEGEIKEGNRVILDIEIFLDKVPVDGGQGKNTSVILGKNYVIPGFDKKIMGAKKGEVKEFSLPYPAEHHDKNLAGKMAEFRVKINDVFNRTLPEVNEEFVKGFGLKSPEELRTNIKKSIFMEKQDKEKQKSEAAMLEKIIGQAKFGDIPEMLIKHEADVMMSELEYSVKKQGGKFDDYLTHLGKTKAQMSLDIMPEAVKRVKASLLIREIGKIEKIAASEDEIHKALDDILKQYKGKKEVEERVNSHAYHDYVENNLTGKKVIEKLREWNIAK